MSWGTALMAAIIFKQNLIFVFFHIQFK